VEVVVPTLLVDRTEVTVAAYAACIADGSCPPTGDLEGCNDGVAGRETHPVNCVAFADAQAYCAWRGRRLPTEWEWEWAARGRDEARTFPWGEEVPGNRACWERAEPKPESTCVAGSRSPDGDSRDGLADMAGNVWEWTDSWYDDTQSSRTVRGASWVNNFESRLRAESRLFNNPAARTIDLGFRCVVEESP
jgi:formylglycine-generating enzyme required for sulfatase activity